MKTTFPPEFQQQPALPLLKSAVEPVIPTERLDLQILRSIRQIMRSADKHSKHLAQTYGITLPQLVCLNKVVEKGPITVKNLAAEIYLSPSTIVGITDRLESRGLVLRIRSEVDRRSVSIEATEKGVHLTLDSPPLLQDAFIKALNRLPLEDQKIMAESLEKIVTLMEIQKVDASPILETKTDLEG